MMDWADRLNRCVAYIEEHLAEEIDYKELGRLACCSPYHFQRMFSCMAGVPFAEYVRKRRMTLAAVELQDGRARVIDVAQKYGYQSPTAFNRAFRAVHGIAPSAVRPGRALRSFPPIHFQLSVKGAEGLEYRIERKEGFRIVGRAAPLRPDMEENFAVVPQMWTRAVADGTLGRLNDLGDAQPKGLLGVCACVGGEPWKYYIAVSSTRESSGWEEYTVPASVWAIFPGAGTNRSVQELERRIFAEWLPASGYEYGDAPDIEVYLQADPQDARYEIWVPVARAGE